MEGWNPRNSGTIILLLLVVLDRVVGCVELDWSGVTRHNNLCHRVDEELLASIDIAHMEDDNTSLGGHSGSHSLELVEVGDADDLAHRIGVDNAHIHLLAIDIKRRHKVDLIIHIDLHIDDVATTRSVTIAISTATCTAIILCARDSRLVESRRSHIDIVADNLEFAEALQCIEDRDKASHIATYGVEVVERR